MCKLSTYAFASLVTSYTLRRRRLAEHHVPHKRTNRDGKHDPAVVCHEEQPVSLSAS